jgi:hypothetical protein
MTRMIALAAVLIGSAALVAADPPTEVKELRGKWDRPPTIADAVTTNADVTFGDKNQVTVWVRRSGGGKLSGERFDFKYTPGENGRARTLTLQENGVKESAVTVTYELKGEKLVLKGTAKNYRGKEVDLTGEYVREKAKK